MEQRKINPWKWQDQYGFSPGIEVSNASLGVSKLAFPGLMIEIEATAVR